MVGVVVEDDFRQEGVDRHDRHLAVDGDAPGFLVDFLAGFDLAGFVGQLLVVLQAPRGVGPYGITTTPNGDVWYASLAGDHIAKIDTVSGDALVVPPPKPGVGPRRIWSDSKGLLWVSLWNTGEVGRYDPMAKTWKVWPLPKSKQGCYAVFVDDKDKVWLTDWPANAIVRFDPVTEKFESFPSDRRNASVRQLLGRPGEMWGAESGTDRLVVIRD